MLQRGVEAKERPLAGGGRGRVRLVVVVLEEGVGRADLVLGARSQPVVVAVVVRIVHEVPPLALGREFLVLLLEQAGHLVVPLLPIVCARGEGGGSSQASGDQKFENDRK